MQIDKNARFNFSDALSYLRKGHTLSRDGWNASKMELKVQYPDEFSKMTFPYLYLTIPENTQSNVDGERRLPWQPSQVDLFSNDWKVLEDGI